MRSMEDRHWYIAVTNPNCHRRAEGGLAELGYPAFWPKMRKWASHARVKVPKEYPILGRYLFVQVPDGNFWAARNVNGIECFLTAEDGSPAEIHHRHVWAFRRRYMAGEWDMIAQSPIPVGARIKIMEGEFADMITVVRGRRNGKLKFLPPHATEFSATREENARAA
jgi:transcription antitermination factor NusG